MTKSAKLTAAAALAVTLLGLTAATTAEAKCKGDVCMIIDTHRTTADTIFFRIRSTLHTINHFNMTFRGVTTQLIATGSSKGTTSAMVNVARGTDKVAIAYCYLPTGATALTCAPAVTFSLPGPWIAIATDGQGHFGWSNGNFDKDSAVQAAIGACKGRCEAVRVATGNCLAYARSSASPAIYGAVIGMTFDGVGIMAGGQCSRMAPGTCALNRVRCIE